MSQELKPVGKDQSLDNSEMVCNRTKNRFGNIKPYDVTRVKLLPIEDEEGSDYINANWMPVNGLTLNYMLSLFMHAGTREAPSNSKLL